MANKQEIEIINFLIDEIVLTRKAQNISHQTLADKVGLNRSAISLIESKKRIPSILNMLKIYNALNLSLGKSLSRLKTNSQLRQIL